MGKYFMVFEPYKGACAHEIPTPAGIIDHMMAHRNEDVIDAISGIRRVTKAVAELDPEDSRYKNIKMNKRDGLRELDRWYESLRTGINSGLMTYQEARHAFVRLQLTVEPHKMLREGNIEIYTVPHRCLLDAMMEPSEDVVAVGNHKDLADLLQLCEIIKDKVPDLLELVRNAAVLLEGMGDDVSDV
jgi:hypothetical protein